MNDSWVSFQMVSFHNNWYEINSNQTVQNPSATVENQCCIDYIGVSLFSPFVVKAVNYNPINTRSGVLQNPSHPEHLYGLNKIAVYSTTRPTL